MVIKMNDFGSSLVSRAAGRSAYERIAGKMASTDDVIVFDFEKVDSITNSFADEVFGRMAFEMGFDALKKRTTFDNIAPFWASVIRTVIDAREADRLAVLA